MERKLILDNKKLKKLLTDKGILIEEGRKFNKEIEDLVEKRNKVAQKIQVVKDKMVPFMDKVKKGKYEDIVSVELNKKGEPKLTILDLIEAFKQQVLEKKKQAKELKTNKKK